MGGAGGLVLLTLRVHDPGGGTATANGTGTGNGAVSGGAARSAGVDRLVAACRAGTSLPYSGVQRVTVLVAGGTRTSLVDVAHLPGDRVRLAVRTDHGEGPAIVGPLDEPSLLPTVDAAALSRMASRYSVSDPRPGPPVAGRPTDVVDLVRTSGSAGGTVAARFWVDAATSLPLQREVLDGTGRLEQSSTYTSISYRPPAAFPPLHAGVGSASDLGRGVGPVQLDTMRRTGWTAPAALPGDFELVDARVHPAQADAGVSPQVLQLAYTDGVSVVSVFEQRGRLDAGALRGWSVHRYGGGEIYVDRSTLRRMVWAGRGCVYTLVSDDPILTDPTLTESVMTAFPAPTGSRGTFGRLQHGAGRLVSWVNPFG